MVQLYIRQHTDPYRPVKELKGFKRITLALGESKRVTFTLSINQLGVYDEEMLFAIHPGKVDVVVGNSSENIPLRSMFEIMGHSVEVNDNKVFFSQVQVQKVNND